ncbi:hypothetical protein EVAR_72940_1, partial [Eumeta japonica]
MRTESAEDLRPYGSAIGLLFEPYRGYNIGTMEFSVPR